MLWGKRHPLRINPSAILIHFVDPSASLLVLNLEARVGKINTFYLNIIARNKIPIKSITYSKIIGVLLWSKSSGIWLKIYLHIRVNLNYFQVILSMKWLSQWGPPIVITIHNNGRMGFERSLPWLSSPKIGTHVIMFWASNLFKSAVRLAQNWSKGLWNLDASIAWAKWPPQANPLHV